MRFSDDFLNELKDRVRLTDYVGRRVRLTRSGKHWKGLSPFKQEKTASFYVDDEKRTYTCYATQNHGDIITFVMETEGLSFQEAVERLADQAGMSLPTESPAEARQLKRRKSLQELMNAAVDFYEACLRGPQGAAARDYLIRERGLSEQAWTRHRIGYAPDDWRQLRDCLTGEGASDDELIEIGLTRPSKRSDMAPYDAFRNRVIFPILDPSGRPVALGGRALEPGHVLKDKGIPKYVNSAETPLFQKSHTIYAYGRARDALHREARSGRGRATARGLIVVEGYMDVIAMAEAGFETAVAPMGTALTEDQLQMLWRAGAEPIMCFDGDSAGRNAAYRAIDLALPHLSPGQSLFFTLLPDGQDPDDLLKTEDGPERMRGLLEGAQPLVDLLWSRELEREPLDTPERRASLEARLAECSDRIAHQPVRAAYARELRDRVFRHFRQQREQGGGGRNWTGGARQAGGGRGFGGGRAPAGATGITLDHMLSEKFPPGLGYVVRAIECPELIEAGRDAFVMSDFGDLDVCAIRDAMLDLQDSCGEVDREAVAAHLRSLGRSRSVKLLSRYPRNEPVSPASPEGRAWLKSLEQFRSLSVLRDEAESTRDAVESRESWERHRRWIAERQAAKARAQDAMNEDVPADDAEEIAGQDARNDALTLAGDLDEQDGSEER